MLNIVLFIISFLLVISSSYLFTSILRSKKIENTIIYFILIAISQVIISIESLSLLKQINIPGLLVINLLIFITSFLLRLKNSSGYADINIFKVIREAKIFQSLRQDKILKVLFVFFCFSSLISLFFALFVPSNSWDSMAYHLARIGFWLQNHSLAHFETISMRQTVFPINSEIMILWPMIFLKRDYLAVMNEYLAYWGCLFVLFSFLKYLKFSTKRILWAIFILASLPALIIESSSTQTNLIIGFLLFCSFYLFVYGTREKDKTAIIFSAISYAIALGTKNTAFFFIPVFGIVYLLISIKESGKVFYKPLLIFLLAIIPAFIILSSYNYILNFIDFGSPFGPAPFVYRHTGSYGIKSFIVNLIKYFIFFIDFSGMDGAKNLSPIIMNAKESLFHILGLNTNYGLAFKDLQRINTFILEGYSTFGILGFLLILPLSFKYCTNLFNFRKDKLFYSSIAGIIIIGFIISISATMGFSFYNSRYFLTPIVLGAPVFIFSYSRKKTVFKFLVACIVVFNYLFFPTLNRAKPLPQIVNLLIKDPKNFRNEVRLRSELYFFYRVPYYYIINYLSNSAPNNSKIGLILGKGDWYYPFFEENPSWKIFNIKYEELFKYKNYDDYDFLVIVGTAQCSELTDFKLVRNSPVVEYFDRNSKRIISGKAISACAIIDISQIPANFKRVNTVTVKETYGANNAEESNYLFYIYKKIHYT